MGASSFISLNLLLLPRSPPSCALTSISNKPRPSSLNFSSSSLLAAGFINSNSNSSSSSRISFNPNPHQKNTQIWRISATSEEVVSQGTPAVPVQDIQPIAVSEGGGVSIIISVLLFIAFVGLSILTIGVIYIAVTDFLTKRERDKFEKAEAEKMKKRGGKKRVLRAKAGPKGFGQKLLQQDDDFLDDD